ncbi:hypothetical protein Cgig2_034205 [Carnegiea gigantea]|uniref:Uncharacterized protein n=1 Tax=Carnegiea gigantea TaxID=171969 RepID=A0A9Q1K3X4_9CARY|nr:hypothetical protein Cgig2_034205 [Carnegiea gigantea]
MVQEDQTQMCSNSSSGDGSRSISKKLKQKKVPQRGLGVAQLEKIRTEEQQKKDASNTTNFSSPSTTLSPIHSSSIPIATFLSYPCNNQSKPSNSFHPSFPPSNLSSPNPIFKTRSVSNFDNFHLGSVVPIMNPTNVGVFDIGWPLVLTHGNHVNVSLPLLWQPYELNLEQKGKNSRLDNHRLSFRSSSSLTYENCPIAPLLDMIPRAQHYQQLSSLVKFHRMTCDNSQRNLSLISSSSLSSSSSSSSSSSVLNFPMERPSSQSYYSNYSPLWLEDEKIAVGMKRPYPFALHNPPIPTFQGKITDIMTHPISQTDESTSCGNEGITFNFEPAIPIFREVASCPSVMLELTNTKKGNKWHNGNSNGEFLTLTPPAIATNSRFKQSSTTLASHNREFCNFESLPYQATIEDLVVDSRQVGSSQQPKFFSLFPAVEEQVASSSFLDGHHSFAAAALVVTELAASPLLPPPEVTLLDSSVLCPDLYCRFPIQPGTRLAQSIEPLHV